MSAADKFRLAATAAKEQNDAEVSSGVLAEASVTKILSGATDKKATAKEGNSAPPPKAGINKLRAAAMALSLSGSATPWGDYSHLMDADISKLSNEKLKRHLDARNELADGTKHQLIQRLRNSLEEERQRKLAIELELEAKHRKIADLEELGAIYVCGKGNLGQLGLGDTEDRHQFTIIPSTRGKHFQHVSTGGNVALATTERHEVYAWGGAGLGPSGLNPSQKSLYKTPQLVEKLNGEEVVITSIGANHSCACSDGGDLFVWGFGIAPQPQYLDTITIAKIQCGEMHSCAITKENEVYAWGLCANGRLGCGETDNDYQTIPFPVRLPQSEVVRLVACGSEHTLLCTETAVYSFGCGDGGRLGQGDSSDRNEPCEITSLRGMHVLSLSAGTWHSACVVHVVPFDDSGWLYVWGR